MRQFTGPRLGGAMAVVAAVARLAFAQGSPSRDVILNQRPSDPKINACLPGTDFQAGHYRIANVTLDDPFRFLRLFGRNADSVESQLRAKLVNQPFTYQAVKDGLALIEKTEFAPNNNDTFFIRVEKGSLQNCDGHARTLDIIYRIYSTDPPKFLGGAVETQQTAEKSPQTPTGMTQTGAPLHFTPSAGYNRADGVFGGGHIQADSRSGKLPVFNSFSADIEESHSLRNLSAALQGSADWMSWLKHADWRLNYTNLSEPAGGARLSNGEFSGQADLQSRAFWNGAVEARAGGLLARGIMQAGGASEPLPATTIANTAYDSLKLYAGVSSRVSHNVLSMSYGLELGSDGHSTQIDWRKHIGDVSDQFWINVGDHKPLEIESRFTAGGIQVVHSVPLAARFFGGNTEQYFVPGDSWQILAAPYIRAIPSNRFFLTGQGAGADRFASLNLTVSLAVKSMPMMPKDLSADQQFNNILNAQINSATSVEQNYYTWKDPHFAGAYALLNPLGKLLDNLQTAVTAAQTAHPGQFGDQFAACTTDIGTANWYVSNALQSKSVSQYGNVAALLPADTDELQTVLDDCGDLNRQLKDDAVGAAASKVNDTRTAMLAAFNAIDQKAAAQKAANDIAFVRRTLNTLFKDFNIFSISPVAVFDSAWLGPGKGALGGNRIGPGFGVRLELASYVNFTVGYAWNVNRQPGEGIGALFFSIDSRDLFH